MFCFRFRIHIVGKKGHWLVAGCMVLALVQWWMGWLGATTCHNLYILCGCSRFWIKIIIVYSSLNSNNIVARLAGFWAFFASSYLIDCHISLVVFYCTVDMAIMRFIYFLQSYFMGFNGVPLSGWLVSHCWVILFNKYFCGWNLT